MWISIIVPACEHVCGVWCITVLVIFPDECKEKVFSTILLIATGKQNCAFQIVCSFWFVEVVTFCSLFPDRNILPASAAQALSAATGTVCWAPRPSKVSALEKNYFKMTAFKIFSPIELNDLWSKKICGPEMIVWSSATFILRDRWRYQIGWMFGKVSKGGGGHFQPKNLYCRFWAFR